MTTKPFVSHASNSSTIYKAAAKTAPATTARAPAIFPLAELAPPVNGTVVLCYWLAIIQIYTDNAGLDRGNIYSGVAGSRGDAARRIRSISRTVGWAHS